MEEETIGQRIKRLREARGFTLPGLARHLVGLGAPASLTKAAIYKWETGDTKNMKNATFVLLAQALGTDAAYLLWGQHRSPLPPKAAADSARNAKG
jgi:transcriptional regulator with XRE-family HTH domain